MTTNDDVESIVDGGEFDAESHKVEFAYTQTDILKAEIEQEFRELRIWRIAFKIAAITAGVATTCFSSLLPNPTATVVVGMVTTAIAGLEALVPLQDLDHLHLAKHSLAHILRDTKLEWEMLQFGNERATHADQIVQRIRSGIADATKFRRQTETSTGKTFA